MNNFSRRDVLRFAAKSAGAASLSSVVGSFLTKEAFSQSISFSDYKAIVLLNLAGGNDGNNTIVPLDSAGYTQYRNLRQSVSLAVSECIPLSVPGQTLGVHGAMKNVGQAINSGKACALLNVGQTQRPLTKAALAQNPSLLPSGLQNHSACRQQWESSSIEPAPATGWGGRLAEILSSGSNGPLLFNTSQSSLFTAGPTGERGAALGGTASFGVAQMSDAAAAIADIDAGSSNNLVAQTAKFRQVALKERAVIVRAQTAGGNISTVFPNSGIGTALSNIAKVINGRSEIGAPRQIFLCQQDGFDTHGSQRSTQSDRLSLVDAALGAFLQAMEEIGMSNKVLICTYSEFSRSMMPNSSNGTDHAWGNHQFILGGGIKGGRFIGSMPSLDIGGKDDVGSTGVWIPSTSVTQMVGGIGEWFGLTRSQMVTLLPDLPNFPDYVHLT